MVRPSLRLRRTLAVLLMTGCGATLPLMTGKRRVGRNWWREHNMELFTLTTIAWEQDRERVALGYDTEMREYERDHPRITLKELLVGNAGMHTDFNRHS